MRLLALDNPQLILLAAGWLGRYDNYKWLDFGNGVQQLTPVTLRIMTQRALHVVRLYTDHAGELPVGVVGLTNVDRNAGTASLWAVLGNKRYGGCTRRACSMMLTLGFAELGLRAVSAWTLDTNIAARHALESLHFSYVGRIRQCHHVDGHPHDRLLFDLLASEHRGEAGDPTQATP